MAVRIRMQRHGRKHRPYFRIVAIDSRQPRDGRFLEELGTYDPMVPKTDDRVKLVPARIKYWLSQGALPSEKCAVLFKKYMAKWERPLNPAATLAIEPYHEHLMKELIEQDKETRTALAMKIQDDLNDKRRAGHDSATAPATGDLNHKDPEVMVAVYRALRDNGAAYPTILSKYNAKVKQYEANT